MRWEMNRPLLAPYPVPPPHPLSSVDWSVLYQEFGERVFRMLDRMTGDAALGEDLTHDVFVRIHEARHQFDGAGEIGAWVFRIAGNLARDELRRAERHARRLTTEPNAASHVIPDPALRLTLEQALAALDPGHRSVVLLHDVDGYSHAEIAQLLGIREGTSRARLSRARHLLRAALGAG